MGRIDTSGNTLATASYIRASMREPMLAREHEQSLARRWRDLRDEAALHELVRSYTRLVIAIASRFRRYGLPMADLVQEGNVGLMQAAERFDPERDVRFSAYATWWIRSAMQDYVLRNWSIVRTGTTAAQKSLFFNMRRLRTQLEQTSGDYGPLNEAGADFIAETLGVSVSDVEQMEQRLSAGDRSLSASLGDDGDTAWVDLLADDRPDPEDTTATAHDVEVYRGLIGQALNELDNRERLIVEQRLMREQDMTLEALGQQLGISKERVRQLESRALGKLRLFLTAQLQPSEAMAAIARL